MKQTLNRVYTKTGDKGQTSLVDGTRVEKTHPRLSAYGDVDELNSAIGMVISFLPTTPDNNLTPLISLKNELIKIQHHLFSIGSHLACSNLEIADALPKIGEEATTFLEKSIDLMTEQLPELKNFILPGGTSSAASLHIARTICRRAERHTIEINNEGHNEQNPEILRFLNRLSDYLFVASRFCNFISNHPETLWKK